MTTATTKMTAANVTSRPQTKPAMTADGVATGMHVTLAESVAMTDAGDVIQVPAGALLTAPLSGGNDDRLAGGWGPMGSTMASRCKLGTDGPGVTYRV